MLLLPPALALGHAPYGPAHVLPNRSSGHAVNAQASGPADGSAVVHTARGYLGVPYVWGGVTPQGFDCSGFVRAVFAQHGFGLPRVSREQARIGLSVSRDSLVAGDLIFFTSQPNEHRITHVAISLGGSRFIHEALGRGEVAFDNLDQRYYAARFSQARRPLALPPGQYATNLGTAVEGASAQTANEASWVASHRRRLKDPYAAQKASLSAAEVAADALEEHDDLPPQLNLSAVKQSVLSGIYELFGPSEPPHSDTSAGVLLGTGMQQTSDAAFVIPQLRYFGPNNGVQIAVGAPFVLLWGRKEVLGINDSLSWKSARQASRVLRAASVGRPGAKLYAALRRDISATLGEGILMRHFVPNAASNTLGDLLIVTNALTAQMQFNLPQLQAAMIVDDVLAPQVVGASVRLRPWAKLLSGGMLPRLEAEASWAADLHAPTVGDAAARRAVLAGAELPRLGERGLHSLGLGLAGRVFQSSIQALRIYVTGSLLMAPGGGPSGMASTLGVTWGAFWPRTGGQSFALVVRAEGRLSGARARPALFDFAYAAARRTAFVDGSIPVLGLPMQDLLAHQGGQPKTIGGLVEAQATLSSWAELGLSFADAGSCGELMGVPRPSDLQATAFVGLPHLSVGPGHRLLRLRAVWSQVGRRGVWPPWGKNRSDTFAMAHAHLDLADWLDVTLSARHALGPTPSGARSWSGLAAIGVHFVF